MNYCARTLLLFAAGLLLLANIAAGVAQDGKNPARKTVPVIVAWGGSVENSSNGNVKGVVLNALEWKKLWAAWRKDGPEPIVLVVLGDGVNYASSMPTVDANGDLQNSVVRSTLAPNPKAPPSTTTRYQFAVISKTGIKSIAGVPLDKK